MAASALRIWGWPLALGLLTTTGLLTALVSDAWGDVWSWVGLGIPVVAMTWFGLRRQSDQPRFHASRKRKLP
ncbi:MAG: hypothetical protein QHC78_00060 [Pigmentiphaga sp.]|uniref:hypothetical protein n=1 Tax=Pigmentiphaga sp. TaxID=1977564 RepID=UPI0029BCADCD|nr:hypothetical protein [Pigmentiphaga sp.]MDX3904071.1 hypothetical protein [Pigmentiphaga sp.]